MTVKPTAKIGATSALATVPHRRDPNRTATGTFATGNTVKVTHGGRRARPLADPEQSDLFLSWARDLGGVDELTAGERATLRRIAEADAVCRTAYTYLTRTKETITSARVQKALSVLAAHSATVFRGAALLGLERRARPVPTVAEWVAEQAQTQTQAQAGQERPE